MNKFLIFLFKRFKFYIIFCVLFFNTNIYCKEIKNNKIKDNNKDFIFNIKDIELIELIEKIYEKPYKKTYQGNKTTDFKNSFEETEEEKNVNKIDREKDNKTDINNLYEKKIGETYFNKIDGGKDKKTYNKKENKTYNKKENKTPEIKKEGKADKPKIDFNKFYKRINKKMIDEIYDSDLEDKNIYKIENKPEIEFDKRIIDKIEKKYKTEIDENGIDRIEIAEEEEKIVIEKQVDKENKLELLPLIDYKIGDKLNLKNNKFNEIKRKLLNTGHFSNVSINIKSINDKDIILQIFFTRKDIFDIIKLLGIKEKDRNNLYNIIGLNLSHNTRFNDDLKTKIVNIIQGYYENNGYLDVTFNFEQIQDSSQKNLLLITVNKGRMMKITKFLFEGNYSFTEKQLKKVLNKLEINYNYSEIIKKKIIDFYLTNGFKDVEITSFYLEKEKPYYNNYLLKINEGKKYILGNIYYQGNNSFNDEYLNKLIGLKPGDVYNTLLLNNNILDRRKKRK
ncbi:MAG: POTRA domain-containing protein [Candidatus Karelsulcia muelleri]